jgi:single-strand DNA-binding protein
MNKLIVIGNVGRDPEMKYTTSGQAITSFSVASNYRYKTASGEQREETEWFNCSAFGKTAEICNQYITKGQQVYIEGRLKSRTYQTQSGETRFSNDITITEVQFLGRRDDQRPDSRLSSGEIEAEGGAGEESDTYDDSDDLPF